MRIGIADEPTGDTPCADNISRCWVDDVEYVAVAHSLGRYQVAKARFSIKPPDERRNEARRTDTSCTELEKLDHVQHVEHVHHLCDGIVLVDAAAVPIHAVEQG